MGNSRAYPVFRTADASAAYTQAKRLCALLAECDDEVGLFAELRTVADVQQMAAVLPEANFDYAHTRTGPARRVRTPGSPSTLRRRTTPHWSRTCR
ncbi:hypothetical protein [Streptomyces sp. IB201691-2A2]|uniref:hypothetical protein n=1 Tax=Streptomyces sp. IB201691-2A2 TaxID=2561920 RepID=UPI0021B0B513|nr:hypothetical protein [Streptomyces sp. IB201691-2A2]